MIHAFEELGFFSREGTKKANESVKATGAGREQGCLAWGRRNGADSKWAGGSFGCDNKCTALKTY